MNVRLALSTSVVLLSLAACRPAGFLYPYQPVPSPSVRLPESVDRREHAEQIRIYDKIDIIWVVDNSGSMKPHQDRVKANMATFIEQFSGAHQLSWRMGVLSTTRSQTPFTGFAPDEQLNSETHDPIKQFNDAIRRLSDNGMGEEYGLAPVVSAITRYPMFIRSDAYLVLIFVTDADDQSSEYTPQAFVDLLTVFKKDRRAILPYGLFAAHDFGCPPNPGEDVPLTYKGSRYESVFQLVNGRAFSLCMPNFGEVMAQIGRELYQNHFYAPRVALESRPEPETLRVTYHGRDVPGGNPEAGGYWAYDYEANSIVFYNAGFLTPGDLEFTVSYTVAF